MAISLPDMVRATNHFSMKNSPGCVSKLIGSSPKDLYLKYNVTCHLPKSDPDGHTVELKFDVSKVVPGSTAKDLDVKLKCSCPGFQWWSGAYNSKRRDGLLSPEPAGADIAPTQRLDLRGNYVLCKHCWIVASKILPSVQHNINNIVRKRQVEEYRKKNINKPPTSRLLQRRKKQREEAKNLSTPPVTRTEPVAQPEFKTVEEKKKWLSKLKGTLSKLKEQAKKLTRPFKLLKNKLFK